MIVSVSGDYGKPRPAVVVQADVFSDLESVVVALMTSDQRTVARLFRIAIEPDGGNGLQISSDVMVDKLFTLPPVKINQRIGRLAAAEMRGVNAALGTLLGV